MASSGNFCTWNPINAQGGGTPDLTRSGTLTNGNLNYTPGSYGIIIGNVGVQTGKWYWELRATGANASGPVVGWLNERHTSGGSGAPSPGYNSPSSATDAQFLMIYMIPGSGPAEITAGTPSSSSSGADTDKSGITTNDIIGLAADFDNDKWYFSINGSFTDFRSGQDPAAGANPLCSGSSGGGLTTFTRVSGLTWYPTYGNWSASGKASYVNFGQDSTFGGEITAGGNADENGFGDFKYSVPAGFKAMCSGNLPISDDIDPAQTDDDYPSKLCTAVTFTGNGGTNNITGVGFQPDLAMFKNRGTANSWILVDSSRGGTGSGTKALNNDGSGAESTGAYTTWNGFASDGFNLSGGGTGTINQSSASMYGMLWKLNGGTTVSNTSGDINSTTQASDKTGLSIVLYTGNGSQGQTIGHGLTKAPEMVWFKNRSNASVGGLAMDWTVALSTATGSPFASRSGSAQCLALNTTAAIQAFYRAEGNFTPTTSTFSVPNNGNAPYWFNANGDNYYALCWHSVEGFSKFGFYEGNGNANGPFVYTGFRPRMLFLKRTDSTGAWHIYDTARNTYNPVDNYQLWNAGQADDIADSNDIDFLSNGFKIRNSAAGLNASGGDYIYGAWGDVSFKYNNTF